METSLSITGLQEGTFDDIVCNTLETGSANVTGNLTVAGDIVIAGDQVFSGSTVFNAGVQMNSTFNLYDASYNDVTTIANFVTRRSPWDISGNELSYNGDVDVSGTFTATTATIGTLNVTNLTGVSLENLDEIKAASEGSNCLALLTRWTQKTSPSGFVQGSGMAYSPVLNRIVAISSQNVSPFTQIEIANSDDGGQTWTTVAFAPGQCLPRSICWSSNHNKFVAVGLNTAFSTRTIIESANGITWTAVAQLYSIPFNVSMRQIEYDATNKYFIAIPTSSASQFVYRSTNGINWVAIAAAWNGVPNTITVHPTKGWAFVSILNSNRIYYSKDKGLTWTYSTTTTSGYWAVGACNPRASVFMIGDSLNGYYSVSTDLTTWTEIVGANVVMPTMLMYVPEADAFLSSDGYQLAYTMNNATSWTLVTTGLPSSLFNTKWLWVKDYGRLLAMADAAFYTSDPITPTYKTTPLLKEGQITTNADGVINIINTNNLNIGGVDYKQQFSASGGLLTYNGSGQYGLSSSAVRNQLSATGSVSYNAATGVISSNVEDSKWTQTGSSLIPKTSLNIGRVGIGMTSAPATPVCLQVSNQINSGDSTLVRINSINSNAEVIELSNAAYGNYGTIIHNPVNNRVTIGTDSNPYSLSTIDNGILVSANDNFSSVVLGINVGGIDLASGVFTYDYTNSELVIESPLRDVPTIFKGFPTGQSFPVETAEVRANGVIVSKNQSQNTRIVLAPNNGAFGVIEATDLANSTKRPLALQAYGGSVGIGTTNPTSRLDVSGDIHLTSNILMENGGTIAAKNSSGTYETVLWGRWTDNATYMNYGSSGMYLRSNDSKLTTVTTNDGKMQFYREGPHRTHPNSYERVIPEFGRGFCDSLYLWDGGEYNIFANSDWQQRITTIGATSVADTTYWSTKWNGSFMFRASLIARDPYTTGGDYLPTAPGDAPLIRVPVDTRCDNAFFVKTIARDRWVALRAWLVDSSNLPVNMIMLGECSTSGTDTTINGVYYSTRNSSFIGPNNQHARSWTSTWHEWLQFNIPQRYLTNPSYVSNGQVRIALQLCGGSSSNNELFISGFASCANPYSIQQRRSVMDVWRRHSHDWVNYYPSSNFYYNEEWTVSYTTAGRWVQFFFCLNEYPVTTDYIITIIAHGNTWESIQLYDSDTGAVGGEAPHKYWRRGGGPCTEGIHASGLYRNCCHVYIPKASMNNKYVGTWRGNHTFQFRWQYIFADVGVYPRGYIIERATPYWV